MEKAPSTDLRKKARIKAQVRPWLYSGLSLLLMFLIVVFPILYSLYISFTNMSLYHFYDYDFIGLTNYSNALFTLNSGFLRALGITVLWTLVNMVLQFIIAYIIAILLNSPNLKARNFYKTILMIPWAIPGYVSILVWKTGIYNNQFGMLNKMITSMGGKMQDWLGSDVSAFICCTVVNLWLALPYMIMIIDGALKSIDKTYYESAKVDGCSRLRKNLFITIPLIKPIIGPAVIITIFTTFKQFDIVYLMTMQPVNTGANINTVITYAYENAFITSNYGFSGAVSIIIFILLYIFTIMTNQNFSRRSRQND